MGTMLEKKLILPFVTGPAQNGALRKPVLVIVITDGEPVGTLPHPLQQKARLYFSGSNRSARGIQPELA